MKEHNNIHGDAMAPDIYLGLGTNLGHRARNLKEALCRLDDSSQIKRISCAYRSEPWGYTEQPRFINMVVQITTPLPPSELLQALKVIEQDMGRAPGPKWGPRLIDIDILLYGDLILDDSGLTIPHPYLPERDFVLGPLCEIAPDLIHPVLGKSVRDLWQELGRG